MLFAQTQVNFLYYKLSMLLVRQLNQFSKLVKGSTTVLNPGRRDIDLFPVLGTLVVQ